MLAAGVHADDVPNAAGQRECPAPLQAIEGFVKSVLAPAKGAKQAPDAQRELEQLDRRIKTTVGMLADLTFEGFDDLHKVLADLKAKRDALLKRMPSTQQPEKPALSERQLRSWVREQFDRLDELAQRATVDLKDRQLVEAFVQRIEVFPETKTGIVVLHADLESAMHSCSTRVVGGDDPQTDESARSVSQCQQRESILAGAVLGLAGPGHKISGIMPCTVIRPDDMADRILNRDKHPQWQGDRTKMVYTFPANEKLWQQYGQVRAEALRNERGLAEATEFYRQHQEAMDEGAIVAWPERFNPDELSAVQHAMNLRLQNEAAFFAEYQNEPLPEKTADDDLLTADQIAAKTHGLDRAVIPLGCNHLTVFIDVQQKLLFFVVCAWEDDFTGYVVDYGTYPDQRRPYFTLRDATRTLSVAAKGTGLEGAIYAGLETLTNDLITRRWRRDDGAELRIDRCLIDANWGSSTDVVYQFCRQSSHAGIVLPSHGRFVGASSRPFSEYTKKPGDRVGLNWRMTNVAGKRAVRHVVFDTNYWKSFVQARLLVAQGDPGCLSLFGTNPDAHRLFAEHLTAEYRVKTEGRGRTVDEWKIRPEQPDNHWLDGVVGCAVAASMQGCILFGTDERDRKPRERVRLSALQRSRR